MVAEVALSESGHLARLAFVEFVQLVEVAVVVEVGQVEVDFATELLASVIQVVG